MSNNIIETLKSQSAKELLPYTEAVLKKLENESYEDMLLYDVKEEWISEIIDNATGKMKKNVKVLKDIPENFCIEGQSATPLQKMCYYKIANIYDCDVSLRNIIIYVLAYGLSDTTIERQGAGSQKFCLKGNHFDYRGDTMNSYNTTINEFLRLFGDDKDNPKVLRINQSGPHSGKFAANNQYSSWSECILYHYDYFKNILPCEAHKFIGLNHTIGNFISVPFKNKDISFNGPRGLGNTKDYWDLALLHIYNWYSADKDDVSDESLLKIVKTKENGELCEAWLKEFVDSEGQPSWNAFIERNYLEDFVEKKDEIGIYGKPLELWDSHFDLKNSMPVSKIEFMQFFSRASNIILARGRRMVIMVKEKLQDEKNI